MATHPLEAELDLDDHPEGVEIPFDVHQAARHLPSTGIYEFTLEDSEGQEQELELVSRDRFDALVRTQQMRLEERAKQEYDCGFNAGVGIASFVATLVAGAAIFTTAVMLCAS